jgi:hypothetical protein
MVKVKEVRAMDSCACTWPLAGKRGVCLIFPLKPLPLQEGEELLKEVSDSVMDEERDL